MHFVVFVPGGAARVALLVLKPEEDSDCHVLAMAEEESETGEAPSFSAVVTLRHNCAYQYKFKVWQTDAAGQTGDEEEEEREVVPTRHREIVVSTFGLFGKHTFSFSQEPENSRE